LAHARSSHGTIQLQWANLTAYDLHPDSRQAEPRPTWLEPFPFPLATFDLVILDGHRLHTHVPSEKTRDWDWPRLLISQLIIGLETVKHGGNVVIKLSRPELPITARVLFTFKPTIMHMIRGSFYAVAHGINRSKLHTAVVALLKEVWWDATFAGEDGLGVGINESLLDNIVPLDEICDIYIDRLGQLGNDVWETQLKGLTEMWARKGICF